MRWGRRRASSVRMDSGMRVGETSSIGLPATPASLSSEPCISSVGTDSAGVLLGVRLVDVDGVDGLARGRLAVEASHVSVLS